MKKNFCKLMAIAVAALMMMSTIAFANPVVDATDVAETTVTLTGLPANEEATVLVVKAGTDLAKLANTDIVFIDQLTIDGDGNVSFPMDISAAADATNNEVDKVDVYCGYTSMTGDVLSALGVAVEKEVTGPEFDLAKSAIASKFFNKTGFKRVFLKITEPGVWTLTHKESESEIYYSTERLGYDCMLKTEATTVEDVIKEITGVKEAPVADMTIKLYGDSDLSGKINVLDIAVVKKYIKKTENNDTLGMKKVLAMDTTGDANINVLDIANHKKYIKKTISEMPVASANR